MHGMIHALNVTTLAGWLSAAGLAVVAGWLPDRPPPPPRPGQALVAEWVSPEIELGEEGGLAGEPGATTADGPAPDAAEPDAPAAPAPMALAEALPAPPELAESAALPPLPELPAPAARHRAARAGSGAVGAPRPAARPAGNGAAGSPGVAAIDRGGGGGAMSRRARLAAGRKPQPAYPEEARRRNQEGSVTVTFTVGADGSVVSARIERPSRWPLLDDAAVRGIRCWRFPAGPVMELRQQVTFRLR